MCLGRFRLDKFCYKHFCYNLAHVKLNNTSGRPDFFLFIGDAKQYLKEAVQ